MFSRDELIQHACSPGDDDDLPLMQVAEFHKYHFRRLWWPGRNLAHCGSKADFASALDFWLWSLQLTDRPTTSYGFLHFAEEALCEPIDDETWFEIMESFTACLKRRAPEFLRRRDSFVSGMTMYRGVVLNASRGSFLAEFGDDYVAFHTRVYEL